MSSSGTSLTCSSPSSWNARLRIETKAPRTARSIASSASEASSPSSVEPILREFEWRLLELLGYGFSLTEDADQQPVLADTLYRWSPDLGLYPVVDTTSSGLSGRGLLAMAALDWASVDALPVAKRLMRQVLAVHLGDRPLVSRQLFAAGRTGEPR